MICQQRSLPPTHSVSSITWRGIKKQQRFGARDATRSEIFGRNGTGGGHPWWGLLFGWASLGRYRVAWFADEGEPRGERGFCLPFDSSFGDYRESSSGKLAPLKASHCLSKETLIKIIS